MSNSLSELTWLIEKFGVIDEVQSQLLPGSKEFEFLNNVLESQSVDESQLIEKLPNP